MLFFFQAEDGIRDTSVTGVQTCALPISARYVSSTSAPAGHGRGIRRVTLTARRCGRRSEERRVGKEWRCWWALRLEYKKNCAIRAVWINKHRARCMVLLTVYNKCWRRLK